MPHVHINQMLGYARQYAFVAPDFESERMFAIVDSAQVNVQNYASQLDAAAANCRLRHGDNCGCIAQKVTRTAERTMLVLLQVR